MTIGKFNIMDIAKIQVSANGKTQTIDFAGPKKLKAVENDEEKRKEIAIRRRAREISGRERFSEGVGPE